MTFSIFLIELYVDLFRFRIHPLSVPLKINTGNILMFINTESRGALAIVQGGLCQIDKRY